MNRISLDDRQWIIKGLREQNLPNLRAYYRTDWWQTRRFYYFRTCPRMCQKCQATERIQLHHVRYCNMWCEPACDLMPLCVRCHHREHKKINRQMYRERHRILNHKPKAVVERGVSYKPHYPKPKISIDELAELQFA